VPIGFSFEISLARMVNSVLAVASSTSSDVATNWMRSWSRVFDSDA
jgi:hypothetical protein